MRNMKKVLIVLGVIAYVMYFFSSFFINVIAVPIAAYNSHQAWNSAAEENGNSKPFNIMESRAGEMINIAFQTIEKESKEALPGSYIDVFSGGERIDLVSGDFDGLGKLRICSKKIKEERISLTVYGLKCEPLKKEYLVHGDTTIVLALEFGPTIYQSLEDQTRVYAAIGIPWCGLVHAQLIEEDTYLYQHCDGRIKRSHEIPIEERSDWERLEIKEE